MSATAVVERFRSSSPAQSPCTFKHFGTSCLEWTHSARETQQAAHLSLELGHRRLRRRLHERCHGLGGVQDFRLVQSHIVALIPGRPGRLLFRTSALHAKCVCRLAHVAPSCELKRSSGILHQTKLLVKASYRNTRFRNPPSQKFLAPICSFIRCASTASRFSSSAPHQDLVAPTTKSSLLITQRVHRHEDPDSFQPALSSTSHKKRCHNLESLQLQWRAQCSTAVRPCLSPLGNNRMTNSSIRPARRRRTRVSLRRAFCGRVPTKQSSLLPYDTSVVTSLGFTSVSPAV